MITPNANRLEVETEDAITFSLTLATPLVRGLALIIDLAVIYTALIVVNIVLMIASALIRDIAGAFLFLSYFIITVGYFMLFEFSWGGQTIGKRVMKIRVIDAQIQRLSPYQIIVRNLFRVVDSLPLLYALGGIVALCNRKFQRIGDIAASTLVIRTEHAASPAIPRSLYVKFNSFRKYPHIEALLRKNTHPEEQQLALQAVLRRDQLEAQARIEVFAQLAQYFKQKARFPHEIMSELSDEQYVRNCVDSIFRKQQSG